LNRPRPAQVRLVQASIGRARRRRLWPLCLLLGVLACLGVVAALRSPALALTTVTVRGTAHLSEEDVLIAAGLIPGQSMFRISLADVRSRLLSLPRVAGVQASRVWPRAIDVLIEERTGLLLVACGSGWVEIAEDGVAIQIHESLEDAPEHLFELKGFAPVDVALGARLPGPEGLAVTYALARLLVAGEGITMANFGDSGLEVRLTDKTLIYLGQAGSDLPDRASIAAGILAELRATGRRVEYIDVRVPGQPVIKPR
jgi:cell division protein FtsQ